MTTQAQDVARMLREIATALLLSGENRFRAGAYERGADAVEAIDDDLGRVVEDGRLLEVPGIGKALATQITEIVTQGRSEYLVKLTAALPPGALELATIEGLGLPSIKRLSDAGIRSIADLRVAAADGRLEKVRGFGAKTTARLLAKLDRAKAPRGQILLVDALEIVAALSKHLLRSPSVAQVDAVGEVRRACEVVTAISVLARATDAEEALDKLATFARVVAIRERTATSASAQLSDSGKLNLHIASDRDFPILLQQLTGSDEHNAAVAKAAQIKHLQLTSKGLFGQKDGRRTRKTVKDERALYKAIGVSYVAPPLREADEPLRPPGHERTLVQISDIRGLVHCHTTYSDGRQSIEEMARAAEARGLKYLTITDHSPTAHYAGGVEIDRLQRQWDEIAEVQEKVTIRLLRGTESDIVRDGALDYPDAILEQLDVIIGSIHNRYKLDEKDMTERVLRGMRHPFFKIWGHALGRILLHRPPIGVDLDRILDAIATSKAAIEINGDPYRLDMPPLLAKGARERGIKFVISVDAHSTRNYDFLSLGVLMAQRAGLAPSDVLNTLDTKEFIAAVKPIQ